MICRSQNPRKWPRSRDNFLSSTTRRRNLCLETTFSDLFGLENFPGVEIASKSRAVGNEYRLEMKGLAEKTGAGRKDRERVEWAGAPYSSSAEVSLTQGMFDTYYYQGLTWFLD